MKKSCSRTNSLDTEPSNGVAGLLRRRRRHLRKKILHRARLCDQRLGTQAKSLSKKRNDGFVDQSALRRERPFFLALLVHLKRNLHREKEAKEREREGGLHKAYAFVCSYGWRKIARAEFILLIFFQCVDFRQSTKMSKVAKKSVQKCKLLWGNKGSEDSAAPIVQTDTTWAYRFSMETLGLVELSFKAGNRDMALDGYSDDSKVRMSEALLRRRYRYA